MEAKRVPAQREYMAWRVNEVNQLGYDYDNHPGYNATEWAVQQNQAFAYTVRVFGYTMTPSVLASVDNRLNQIEPARSNHFFLDNLTLSNFGLDYNVLNVDSTTQLSCLYVDNGAASGYSAFSTDAP